MALFLSPIDKTVQTELNKRSNRLKDMESDGKMHQVSGEHGLNIARGGLYNRSTWIRVIPQTILKNKDGSKKKVDRPILMGGLLYNKDGKTTDAGEPITGDLAGGLGEGGQYSARDFKAPFTGDVAGGAHRPNPGCTGVDVKQKGDLGSLVDITIKWNCFSFEQLGELSYYFMRPGASLIVEFGWSDAENKTEQEPAPHAKPEEAMFNKSQWLNPNMEFYCGVITNFEWSGRDDGGFDCTTTMTSGGSLIVQQELKASQAQASSISEKGFGDMRDFFVEDGGKLFYDAALGAKLKAGSRGVYSSKTTDEKNFVYASLGWLEDNVFSRFLGFVGDSETKSMEFRSIDWVPAADGNGGIYQPTRITGHPDMVSTNPNEVFIPNRNLGENLTLGEFKEDDGFWSSVWPFDDNKEWSGVIPAFNWTDYFAPIDFASSWSGEVGKACVQDKKVFYWRNIVVSSVCLRNCARNSETVSEFFEALFDQINAYCGNMWKFTLAVDDDNSSRVKVLDVNFTDSNVKELTGKTFGEGEDGIPTYSVFKFPVMTRNSIVKKQSLNMRIPDAAALTAMYGQNSGDAAAMTGEKGASTSQTDGGGGSGTHNDVTMNVLSSLTSADVGIWAEDELLKNLSVPPASHGSLNPYGNIGDPSKKTNYIKDDYTYSGVDFGANENKGHIAQNKKSPWVGLVNYYMTFFGMDSDDEDGKGTNAQDGVQTNKYADADKASELANLLEQLEKDEKLPDELQEDSLYSGSGTSYDKMKEDPDESNTKAFLKQFQKVMWKKLKETGGGWIIPAQLRDYWYWIIKYVDLGTNQGTVGVTNYMLPLELELEVDGIGGVQYGNAFQSEYVPQKYLDSTLFQATEVNHSISGDGWSTTIKGKMRYIDLNTIKDLNK